MLSRAVLYNITIVKETQLLQITKCGTIVGEIPLRQGVEGRPVFVVCNVADFMMVDVVIHERALVLCLSQGDLGGSLH